MIDQWRDISTAPKDGTFLIWLKEPDRLSGTNVGLARYHPNIKIINGNFAFDMPNPTHWMSLPEPPHSDETGS